MDHSAKLMFNNPSASEEEEEDYCFDFDCGLFICLAVNLATSLILVSSFLFNLWNFA